MATNVKSSDETLRQNILAALRSEGGALETHLRVDVCNRVATLTGQVDDWAERLALERAVLNVKGVRALVLALEDRAGTAHRESDREIALAAGRRLKLNGAIPEDALLLEVEDGLITLRGEVERDSHRSLAEDIVLRISGVRGVRNKVNLSRHGTVVNVARLVQRAGLWTRGFRL
ncbi:BON domain-containing protein [Variovorax sp. YR216]|uniref:BON domain-containing protein n=1 Tax=Variovorax sp. YR216 TaxID=1882828 RepID=UPI00089C347D|nr:BON domain-containing protein [Variovorax sp. YR216]SEB24358.1 Osmotically-inducible protein OsmY, contains BON domain [Variovorax sp. YR216]